MLTAWFDINRTDADAVQYTYQELLLHFVWDCSKKSWKRRQRDSTIGRLLFVSLTAGERFYLRTLLTTVKGPTSWQDLCSFEDVEHPTFHAACLAHGLLENDDEWRECLEDASLTHLGRSLRQLYCLILRHCHPSQPDLLWQDFRDNLCNNLGRHLQSMQHTEHDIDLEDIYDFGLFLIDEELS